MPMRRLHERERDGKRVRNCLLRYLKVDVLLSTFCENVYFRLMDGLCFAYVITNAFTILNQFANIDNKYVNVLRA